MFKILTAGVCYVVGRFKYIRTPVAPKCEKKFALKMSTIVLVSYINHWKCTIYEICAKCICIHGRSKNAEIVTLI